MIPGISLEGVLTPLNLTSNPLISTDDILNSFSKDSKGNQVRHFKDDVLKPEIKKILFDRGLIIDKVDAWRWNVEFERNAAPHTDGDFRNSVGRKVGLNWSIINDGTGVEFYDTSSGNLEFEEENDGRTHTLWNFPSGTAPKNIWWGRYPSLINPQTPHHITGPKNSFRHSITLKFLGNPSYNDVLEKLWDLRLDKDFWKVNVSSEDINYLRSLIEKIEKEQQLLTEDLTAYNLPRRPELLRLLEKYCKKPIKSMRVFTYKRGSGAKQHIDYDNNLKVSPTYALNIPLYGSDNCFIDFYKNTGGTIEKWSGGTGSFLWPADETQVFYSSTLKINSPHLIRVNIPHAVRIEDQVERKVLSVRFIDNEYDLPSDITTNLQI